MGWCWYTGYCAPYHVHRNIMSVTSWCITTVALFLSPSWSRQSRTILLCWYFYYWLAVFYQRGGLLSKNVHPRNAEQVFTRASIQNRIREGREEKRPPKQATGNSSSPLGAGKGKEGTMADVWRAAVMGNDAAKLSELVLSCAPSTKAALALVKSCAALIEKGASSPSSHHDREWSSYLWAVLLRCHLLRRVPWVCRWFHKILCSDAFGEIRGVLRYGDGGLGSTMYTRTCFCGVVVSLPQLLQQCDCRLLYRTLVLSYCDDRCFCNGIQ